MRKEIEGGEEGVNGIFKVKVPRSFLLTEYMIWKINIS